MARKLPVGTLKSLASRAEQALGLQLPAWGNAFIPKTTIARYLPRDPIIVEGGAHIGTDTVDMSRIWPNGVIYAFEPIPEIFERLKQTTSTCSNVFCQRAALSDWEGAARMFVSSGASDQSSSLMRPKDHLLNHPDVRFDDTAHVQSVTLDEWARRNSVDRVDFLWLDVQGNELAALQGGQRLLPTVRAMHLEVSVKEVYEGAPLYDQVRAWLGDRGFRVEREKVPAGWDGGNVLFVRDRA